MNLAKLQGMALRLTRAFPTNASYTWWVVTVILLQAREAAIKTLQPGASVAIDADKLIEMALNMIEKKALAPPQEGVSALTMEPLLLYVEALRAAGKYTEAATVVRNAVKALPIVADRKRLEAEVLLLLLCVYMHTSRKAIPLTKSHQVSTCTQCFNLHTAAAAR